MKPPKFRQELLFCILIAVCTVGYALEVQAKLSPLLWYGGSAFLLGLLVDNLVMSFFVEDYKHIITKYREVIEIYKNSRTH